MRLVRGQTGQAELGQLAFTRAGPVSILRPIQSCSVRGMGGGGDL